MNVWRLSRKDAAVGIILLVLLAIAIWSFITRADVGTIYYEGRAQTGSVLDWSYRLKSRRIIPEWARFSTRMVSERATFLSQKGSHGLIHAFVAPRSMDEWDLGTSQLPEASQPVQLVDSELEVESQKPFEIFVSPIFDSRILFFSGDELALFVRNDAMYSMGGQLGPELNQHLASA